MKTLKNVMLAIAGGLLAVSTAFGQGYPESQVRVVVPYPAGGSTDMVGRLVAQHLAGSFAKPFIVDNRAGAGGSIGMDAVAKAPKDGHTLLLASVAYTVNQYLYAKLPYESDRDFAPIIHIANQPQVLVVRPTLDIGSVADLIKYAKANPGKLTYGSAGVGGSQDIAARRFMEMTGTDMLHVPYKGGALALTDLLGGQIDLMFETSPASIPYIKSGKLKALAVTSGSRLPVMPELPTVDEAGVRGYRAISWIGLAAPKGVPASVIEKLNTEVNKLIASEQGKSSLAPTGLIPVGGSTANFVEFLRNDALEYAKFFKSANITPQ
jgi:tripartite-type tricarboxylate transporter receptor subunit TctC